MMALNDYNLSGHNNSNNPNPNNNPNNNNSNNNSRHHSVSSDQTPWNSNFNPYAGANQHPHVQMANLQHPQVQSPLWSSYQRRPSNAVDASNIWSNSANPIKQGPSQENSPKGPEMPYEFTRRHSHNDVYSYQPPNPGPSQNQPQLQGNANGNLPAKHTFQNSIPELTDNSTLQLVNEYFETDPHQRVKVTAKLLVDRFFDEEKYLSDAFQLPRFPIEHSLRNYQLVLVGFKAGRIDVFYLPSPQSDEGLPSDLQNLKVGDLVIVEADRGRDLGKVVKLNISIDEARLMKLLQFQEQHAALSDTDNILDEALSVRNLSSEHTSGSGSATSPPTLHFPKSILSLAQPSEIAQILNKRQDEEKACRLCLAKIANATGGLTSGANSGAPTSSATADLLQMKLIDAEYQFDRKKLIFYYSTSKRIDFRDLVRELFRIYKTRIWMCAVVGLPYVPNAARAPKTNTNSATPEFPQRENFDRRFSYHSGMGSQNPGNEIQIPRRFSQSQQPPPPPPPQPQNQNQTQQSFQPLQIVPPTAYYSPNPNQYNQNFAPGFGLPSPPIAQTFQMDNFDSRRNSQMEPFDSRRNSVGGDELWSATTARSSSASSNGSGNAAPWSNRSGITGEGYVLKSLVESMDH